MAKAGPVARPLPFLKAGIYPPCPTVYFVIAGRLWFAIFHIAIGKNLNISTSNAVFVDSYVEEVRPATQRTVQVMPPLARKRGK